MVGVETLSGRFEEIARGAVAGTPPSRRQAMELLRSPDEALRELLWAAYQIRKSKHGNRVKLCVLQNARSGLCPEDCGYCSQSSVSKAPVEKYRLLPKEKLVTAADEAVRQGARRYCMVTSGRGPSTRDIGHITDAVREIKATHPALEVCVSLGLLDSEQARELKDAGVGWVNHNLNTSERFHPSICSTHTYEDRVRTVRNVRAAGLSVCCGGILGMGEGDEDVIDLAFALQELEVDSLPVNLLHAIDGTPLEGVNFLDPIRALKALCVFRFVNPGVELRAAGGREHNLGAWQGLALYPANSIFVRGYLTTPGQAPDDARRMISELGFEVEDALEEAEVRTSV